MTTTATYRDGLPTNLAAAALDALAWLEFYQRVSVGDLVHEEDKEAKEKM